MISQQSDHDISYYDIKTHLLISEIITSIKSLSMKSLLEFPLQLTTFLSCWMSSDFKLTLSVLFLDDLRLSHLISFDLIFEPCCLLAFRCRGIFFSVWKGTQGVEFPFTRN